jgi:hypothetical protein
MWSGESGFSVSFSSVAGFLSLGFVMKLPKLLTGFSVFWRNLAWSLFTNRSVLIAGVVTERGTLWRCRRALLFLLHAGSALEVFVAERLTNQHF